MENKINDGGAALFAGLLNKKAEEIDIYHILELQPYFSGDEMKVIVSLLSNGIKTLTSFDIIKMETWFSQPKLNALLRKMIKKGIILKKLDVESPWRNTPFYTSEYFYFLNPDFEFREEQPCQTN